MTERKYNNDYVQDILHIISSDHTIEEKRNLLMNIMTKILQKHLNYYLKKKENYSLIILI